MNALDILVWAVCIDIMVRQLQKESMGLWVMFGVVTGVGFLNKVSVTWLVIGLGIGILLSSERKLLARPGPWMSMAILGGFALPHIIWQARNNWPTKEFLSNAFQDKMLPIAPWEFLAQQAFVINLMAVPIVIAGIVYGFRADGRKWLPLSVAFLTLLVFLIANGRSRINYLAPAYPAVIALGAVAVEKWFEKKKWKPSWVYVGFALVTPAYISVGLPWLPPEKMTWIINMSQIRPPKEEKGPKSPLQGWSDMIGWPELARDVDAEIAKLPRSDQADLVVVTKNYGEAAALEHFTRDRVICGHNNYYLWGPDGWDGKVALFVNRWPAEITDLFGSFEQVGKVDAPYAVPEQNGSPIWVARGLKIPVAEFFRRIRKFV